jgi:hypothetical protein
MGNEADKNNCQGLIMAQNSLVLNYKRVEYPPDFSIPPISYSDPDALLSLMRGSEPIRKFHGLIQIEFTVNGESQLFPDFDNIFSRSESAKDWWFLAPEIDGKAIYQSDRDISTWWSEFQCIYESSILSTEEFPTPQMLFLISSSTNNLVELLFNQLLVPPTRLSTIDEESPIYRKVYSYNLFRDCGIEKYWEAWLWNKAVINYYHVIFAPTLLEQPDDRRKVLKLSNRFPEYAHAVRELATLREELYSGLHIEKKVDKFFSLQADELKEEAVTRKKASRGLTFGLCQCRVCGLIFPTIKKQGGDKQICAGKVCKDAWGSLRKQLPRIPDDHPVMDWGGGNIRISYL